MFIRDTVATNEYGSPQPLPMIARSRESKKCVIGSRVIVVTVTDCRKYGDSSKGISAPKSKLVKIVANR